MVAPDRIVKCGAGEIKSKRLRLNIQVASMCPVCEDEAKTDLRDNYLSYPRYNDDEGKVEISFYCAKCEVDWEAEFRLNVSLTPLAEDSEADNPKPTRCERCCMDATKLAKHCVSYTSKDGCG